MFQKHFDADCSVEIGGSPDVEGCREQIETGLRDFDEILRKEILKRDALLKELANA